MKIAAQHIFYLINNRFCAYHPNWHRLELCFLPIQDTSKFTKKSNENISVDNKYWKHGLIFMKFQFNFFLFLNCHSDCMRGELIFKSQNAKNDNFDEQHEKIYALLHFLINLSYVIDTSINDGGQFSVHAVVRGNLPFQNDRPLINTTIPSKNVIIL